MSANNCEQASQNQDGNTWGNTLANQDAKDFNWDEYMENLGSSIDPHLLLDESNPFLQQSEPFQSDAHNTAVPTSQPNAVEINYPYSQQLSQNQQYCQNAELSTNQPNFPYASFPSSQLVSQQQQYLQNSAFPATQLGPVDAKYQNPVQRTQYPQYAQSRSFSTSQPGIVGANYPNSQQPVLYQPNNQNVIRTAYQSSSTDAVYQSSVGNTDNYPDPETAKEMVSQPYYNQNQVPEKLQDVIDTVKGLSPESSKQLRAYIESTNPDLAAVPANCQIKRIPAPQRSPNRPSRVQSATVSTNDGHSSNAVYSAEDKDGDDYGQGGSEKVGSWYNSGVVFKPEKPKRDPNRPWCRTNHATAGKSARTGKINNYDGGTCGGYEKKGGLLTFWKPRPDLLFDYNSFGELNQFDLTARKAMDFISRHPTRYEGCKLGSHLILWIQKCPADSVRRYSTKRGAECRFKHCPDPKGTIAVGHYRVAWDERWGLYKDKVDPFTVAGYAHLYCMERFLDFAQICTDFDVRVDDRQLFREPNGKFGASLAREPEYDVAKRFIKACKNGTLRTAYPDYPEHDTHLHGAGKNYKGTLCSAMTEKKLANMQPSKLIKYQARGMKDTQMISHRGDLEKMANGKATFRGELDRKRAAKEAQQSLQDGTTVEVESNMPRSEQLNSLVPVSAITDRKASQVPTQAGRVMELDDETEKNEQNDDGSVEHRLIRALAEYYPQTQSQQSQENQHQQYQQQQCPPDRHVKAPQAEAEAEADAEINITPSARALLDELFEEPEPAPVQERLAPAPTQASPGVEPQQNSYQYSTVEPYMLVRGATAPDASQATTAPGLAGKTRGKRPAEGNHYSSEEQDSYVSKRPRTTHVDPEPAPVPTYSRP